ncbi:MAG: DUF1540 domain-containing protein [Dehalogenimonas sp.]
MSPIQKCNMTVCAYNKDNNCHTPGITVGSHAECSTFTHASARGGFKDVCAGVGACLAADCGYNKMLECSAPKIDVTNHDRHADCSTYNKKSANS